MTDFYPPPLDRLLRLGAEPARRRNWPDYRNLGLEDRHVPGLVRMATDPALHTPEDRRATAWAPVHAWRALGQLRAAAAAEPLLALLEREAENDWVYAEVPVVLGMIGPAALHGATILLFDEARDEELRVAAAGVIASVAHEHPERRDEAAAIITKQLEDWPHQGKLLNAYLITDLAALRETAAAPVIAAAFGAAAVDLEVSGDWEDVQVELGMLADRLTPPAYLDRSAGAGATRAAKAEVKARARRKAEKQARKRNRKKR